MLGSALAAASCLPSNHPLVGGAVEIFFDPKPIYAADVLDESGRPVLPRQRPYEKLVQLKLTSGDAPDAGAYVDVDLDPPAALLRVPVDDTCEHLPGAFRCTAAEDGYANFLLRSESDFSGDVTIKIVGRSEQASVAVKPAGLPNGASDFTILIEGVESTRVPARYNALECTLKPVPDSAFDKWPAGKTRVRQAIVRATAPPDSPSVIEHAPVIVQTLHPEAFVTLDPTCAPPRNSRLRVQLDQLGSSPPFYLCFSDIGGEGVMIAYASGELSGQSVSLQVDAEPRLLRVVTVTPEVTVDAQQVKVVELSAYDADLELVAFQVDVTSTDPTVLSLDTATLTLPSASEDPRPIYANGVAEGTALLQVTPTLHATPVCSSLPITVSNAY